MVSATDITIVTFTDSVSAKELSQKIRKIPGPCLIVFPPGGIPLPQDELRSWFKELKALNKDRSLIVATKHKPTASMARHAGWQAVTAVRQLKLLITGHPQYAEALRTFSPSSWRQDIRTRLQFIGLLSLPKLRIWTLLVTSIGVFAFVFLKLLPNATVQIWPNLDSVSYTTNIYLVTTGAVLPIPYNRVHAMPLVPLTVSIDRTITFDQVGKNFTGTNAQVTLTVFNDGADPFSLRKGTRFSNQAGMVFRIKSDVILSPHSKQDVRAVADPEDLYGEIVGARGNVPAGLKWGIPALTEKERAIVYGRNEHAATGGTTSYANIVKKEDIETARKKLEQELLAAAKQMVDEQRADMNDKKHTSLVRLQYDDLTKIVYRDFNLSESFVGQNVASIPVQGSIDYTVLLYDDDQLLSMLKNEIIGHVSSDKVIVEDSLSKNNVDVRIVPPWDDDFRWLKITASLTYTEKYMLNHLTPIGAKFAKDVRDSVTGKSITDAERIVKNLPEVSKVKISIWPPWTKTLPDLGSNIDVEEQ